MQRSAVLGLTFALMAALAFGGSPPAKAAGFSDYQLGEFYPLDEIDDAVVHEAARAVVRFPSASGFIVDPDGMILTNHHVYESFGKRGTVWRRWVGDGSEQALKVELVSKDAEHDVALYRVIDANGPLPFIELRDSPVERGEKVFVLGHPSGDPLRASFGKILADGLTISGRPSIEYSAQTWWGSSGSPVLDDRGRAVAIHWGWDSTGISNGRLTGVPATKFAKLDGFDDLGRADAAGSCEASGWSLASTLVDAKARKNAGGRWLDRVELRPVHREPGCEATLDAVTIRLHPTFKDPVSRLDPGEALTIYSWGFFDATVELELDDETVLRFVDRVAWK